MRWLAATALLLTLVGCVEEADDVYTGKPLTAAERAECTARGGTPGYGGIFPDEVCFLPEPDAGKACTKATDCLGMCLAESQTCSKVTPMFGCFDFLDETGQQLAICID
jgi:hypothetical protein